MYRDMSNCMNCGRLIAPSSGMSGPNPSSIFCCHRCRKAYYKDHPGLWEQEEENELIRQEQIEEEERLRLESETAWDLFYEQERKKRNKINVIKKIIIYTILFFIILFLLRSCH